MIVVISPAKTFAKTFNCDALSKTKYTQPLFLKQASVLIKYMKKKSKSDLSQLMKISSALASCNYDRYRMWKTPFTPHNARPALFAFRGGVYLGLLPETLSAAGLKYAQAHLRILSGLYGMLRPLDLLQAYRLEMGTRVSPEEAGSLYEYWRDTLTKALEKELAAQRQPLLVNLASNEYFKVLDTKKLSAQIVKPVFKEESKGRCRVISFLAKRARGLMSRFIIDKALSEAQDIKRFRAEGYRYAPSMSTDDEWVFVRPYKQAA